MRRLPALLFKEVRVLMENLFAAFLKNGGAKVDQKTRMKLEWFEIGQHLFRDWRDD